MKHHTLSRVFAAMALLACPISAQEGTKIRLTQELTPAPPKAVVDVLLTINTFHLNEVFQSPEKLKERTQEEINTLIQNSGLGEYAEFRIVGVHQYCVPDATIKNIGMAEHLREQYQADLVLDLGILNRRGLSGQAYTTGMYGEFTLGNNPNPQQDAYLSEVDVIATNNIDTNYSYTAAHELAHLMGGGHCATQSTQPWHGLYPFAAGAVDLQQSAVSLLTYESRYEHGDGRGRFRNLCVLSSPQPYVKDGVSYSIGNAETDNRRCFLMSLPMVAGYKQGSATRVLNDTPQHALELPPLYSLAYYLSRFTQCDNATTPFVLLACREHAPHLLSGNHFTRIWGSTANATHDASPGTAPNVWYRLTAPATANYTAGFRAVRNAPRHHCRIYRKEGSEAVEIPTTPGNETLCFRATQGEELYIEIAAEQDCGVFNFYLASDAPAPALPQFEDGFKAALWNNGYGMSALEYAALNPDPAELRTLLQLDLEDDLQGNSGAGALQLAAILGHTEHCRLLLGAGVSADGEQHLYPPMLLAVSAGQNETAELLREAGAVLDFTDKEKLPQSIPFRRLIEHKCYRAIMRLVDAGIPVDTPLSGSAKRSKKKSSQKEESPKVDLLQHYAAEHGHLEALQFILSKGIDADAPNNCGCTALMLAASKGHADCVKLLLEAGANPKLNTKSEESNALGAAAAQGHADCVKLLLDAGADADAEQYENQSPLMHAMANEHPACTELLLQATADLLKPTKNGSTTLMAAACRENPEMLRMLLEKGADVNACINGGKTALLLAARLSRVENMRLLLEYGANVNAQDNDGNTPLLMATLRGNTESTKLLLAHGADATLADKSKCTPLMQAAGNGNTECVKILLEHGAKDSYTRRQRTTALMLAAAKGAADCVRLLLQSGSKINARDDDRMSPLCFAAKYGNSECLQLLLEAGAKVRIRTEQGLSPLMLAVQKGNTDCARLLLQNGAAANDADNYGNSVLMQAAENGHADCVQLILQQGVPVDATNPRKETALRLALHNDHADCLKILLEHGAAPTQKTEENQTLLHLAIYNAGPQCIRLLCEAGVPMNDTDSYGYTPLMRAIESDETIEAIRTLLQCGADVNTPMSGDNDTTAIRYAMSKDSAELFHLLVQAGANINYRTWNGNTLLHLAAAEGCIELMEAVLKSGADINAKNDYGETPLHLAAQAGHYDHVRWLLAKGADINSTDKQERGIFLHAADSANKKLLKYLIEKKGISPAGVDSQQLSALHLAARKLGSVSAIQYLIDLGLQVNATDAEGKTPLMHAAKHGSTDCMETLTKNGADIRARDLQGRTALHLAAIRESPYVYKELIKLGADPTAKDNDGKTPEQIVKEAKQKREDELYENRDDDSDPVGNILRIKK